MMLRLLGLFCCLMGSTVLAAPLQQSFPSPPQTGHWAWVLDSVQTQKHLHVSGQSSWPPKSDPHQLQLPSNQQFQGQQPASQNEWPQNQGPWSQPKWQQNQGFDEDDDEEAQPNWQPEFPSNPSRQQNPWQHGKNWQSGQPSNNGQSQGLQNGQQTPAEHHWSRPKHWHPSHPNHNGAHTSNFDDQDGLSQQGKHWKKPRYPAQWQHPEWNQPPTKHNWQNPKNQPKWHQQNWQDPENQFEWNHENFGQSPESQPEWQQPEWDQSEWENADQDRPSKQHWKHPRKYQQNPWQSPEWDHFDFDNGNNPSQPQQWQSPWFNPQNGNDFHQQPDDFGSNPVPGPTYPSYYGRPSQGARPGSNGQGFQPQQNGQGTGPSQNFPVEKYEQPLYESWPRPKPRPY